MAVHRSFSTLPLKPYSRHQRKAMSCCSRSRPFGQPTTAGHLQNVAMLIFVLTMSLSPFSSIIEGQLPQADSEERTSDLPSRDGARKGGFVVTTNKRPPMYGDGMVNQHRCRRGDRLRMAAEVKPDNPFVGFSPAASASAPLASSRSSMELFYFQMPPFFLLSSIPQN